MGIFLRFVGGVRGIQLETMRFGCVFSSGSAVCLNPCVFEITIVTFQHMLIVFIAVTP